MRSRSLKKALDLNHDQVFARPADVFPGERCIARTVDFDRPVSPWWTAPSNSRRGGGDMQVNATFEMTRPDGSDVSSRQTSARTPQCSTCLKLNLTLKGDTRNAALSACGGSAVASTAASLRSPWCSRATNSDRPEGFDRPLIMRLADVRGAAMDRSAEASSSQQRNYYQQNSRPTGLGRLHSPPALNWRP